MKRFCKFFAVCSILLLPLIFSSCASTDWSNVDLLEPGDYIGQYDESMTPENSCVILFFFMDNDYATFRQINSDFPEDIQHFEYKKALFKPQYTIFKPCKPGSRYMLTDFKGSNYSGNFHTTWEMEFSPKQKYFVIDVPKEPGIYAYTTTSGNDIIWGLKVAEFAHYGNVFQIIPDGKDAKTTYKHAVELFAKHYAHTPWYDAFLEKREKMMGKK